MTIELSVYELIEVAKIRLDAFKEIDLKNPIDAIMAMNRLESIVFAIKRKYDIDQAKQNIKPIKVKGGLS